MIIKYEIIDTIYTFTDYDVMENFAKINNYEGYILIEEDLTCDYIKVKFIRKGG